MAYLRKAAVVDLRFVLCRKDEQNGETEEDEL